jgi:hypothetical protein
MNSSDPTPKLPMWIFFLTDAVLLGAAWLIAAQSARPLSPQASFLIFGCIFGGALIALVPLVARYERQKNEQLDERQRELAALGRTVTASAEQISIATSGLHEVVEHAQKTLRHAEQLQQKLHERIAEFHARIATASDSEKEEMEKELETLRASETERLQAIADKIGKSVSEWTKLESATSQHLASATDAIGKLSLNTASAIGKAQAAAEQALAQARTEAARTFGEASGNATKALETAKVAALAEIAARSAATRPAEAPKPAPAAEPTPAPSPVSATDSNPPPAAPAPAAEPPPAVAAAASPVAEEPPKAPRPRKTAKTTAPFSSPAAEAKNEGGVAIAAPEPVPILAQKIPEVSPIAPSTSEPFGLRTEPKSSATETAPGHTNGGTATIEAPKPARKRVKAPEPADLPIDSPAAEADADSVRSGVIERVLSSDGATRLLVTSYIGIGNRLFIRGDGPGLSWDKGTPLQFVSIGKWRWETNDATGPVKFKLFKNDDLECAALGAQSLNPGQQQEVTAAF